MSDPLQDVRPGEAPGRLLNSQTFNLQMAATRWWRDNAAALGRRVGALGDLAPDQVGSRLEVRIQPSSTLPDGSIINLGDALIDPTVNPFGAVNTPAFAAVTPAAGGVLAITCGPTESGAIGRAIVSGVAICTVTVTDSTHKFAVAVAGSTSALDSATSGPAQILWKSAATGTVTAAVLLTGEMGTQRTGSGTDNHIVRWDGTDAIQDSLITIGDLGDLTAPRDLFSTGGGTATNGVGISNGSTRFVKLNEWDVSGVGIGPYYGINGSDMTYLLWDHVNCRVIVAGVGAKYSMYWSVTDTIYDGDFGTDSLGNEFHGGICTHVGTATVVTNGANTFTGEQTINSGATAPALDIQQTAGDSSNTLRVRNSAGTTTFAVTGAGDVTANSFSGSGSALSGLNASNLASGTIPSARIGTIDGGTF